MGLPTSVSEPADSRSSAFGRNVSGSSSTVNVCIYEDDRASGTHNPATNRKTYLNMHTGAEVLCMMVTRPWTRRDTIRALHLVSDATEADVSRVTVRVTVAEMSA